MSDLIDRQAAIDAECEVCQIAPRKERGHNCIYYVHGCKEIECLRALPSAQPEPEELDFVQPHKKIGVQLEIEQPKSEERTAESTQNVPKEDLISRKAAIDAVSKGCQEWRGIFGRCEENILALPSAQPERKTGKWIPCSEQLPEEGKDVLVTVYFMGLENKHSTGWNDHIKPSYYVDLAIHIDGEWHSASDEYKVALKRNKVIAWMPLPEPYKERRADERQT